MAIRHIQLCEHLEKKKKEQTKGSIFDGQPIKSLLFPMLFRNIFKWFDMKIDGVVECVAIIIEC